MTYMLILSWKQEAFDEQDLCELKRFYFGHREKKNL